MHVSDSQIKNLQNHKLHYIPELLVDPEIFTRRFFSHSSMFQCNGTCCAEGVLVDVKEKELILNHADLIKKYLEPQQEQDPSKWFDEAYENDIDFPSRSCDGTAVQGKSCVFLCSQGLCALQKTAMADGMNKFALKPFYCVAFPLTIEGHVLTMHEPEFTNRRQCCSTVGEGTLTALDVCREEFEYILGSEGLQEIEALFQEQTALAKTRTP
jgi:hypothetical protein